jgi:hypothetical protein
VQRYQFAENVRSSRLLLIVGIILFVWSVSRLNWEIYLAFTAIYILTLSCFELPTTRTISTWNIPSRLILCWPWH